VARFDERAWTLTGLPQGGCEPARACGRAAENAQNAFSAALPHARNKNVLPMSSD
jgi:hypothetical protein